MRISTLLLLSVFAIGCSGGDAPNETAASSSQAAVTTASVEDEAIRAAAERFLTSLLRGDASEAMRWLTPSAAERAASDPTVLATLDLQVNSLEVGEVRLISEDEAAAQCLLSEAGSETAEEVCCLLKRSDEGWRICGIACDTGPDTPPVLINFEAAPASPAQPAQENPQYVADPPADSLQRTAAGSAEYERR